MNKLLHNLLRTNIRSICLTITLLISERFIARSMYVTDDDYEGPVVKRPHILHVGILTICLGLSFTDRFLKLI